ncbi:MAG: hypothetical protein JXX14_05180, partial [Deltaproteobacteria bacterium]|nr:hypothetical protein [Deltaproteobacteria bacterium]
MKHATLRFLLPAILFAFSGIAAAETVLDVDGRVSDWNTSDAQCMLTETDSSGADYVEIERICVTDSASTAGYFYLLTEFAWDNPNPSLNNVWLRNANLILNVDTDSDGVIDLQIDFINDPADVVYGVINFPYLEARIDYDLVDPDGDRAFSFFIETSWRGGSADRVPYEAGTTVDYSVDPATGSPRAVRMLAQSAVYGENGVTVTWVTASERANLGFHVYRFDQSTERWTRLTETPIPGLGDAPFGKKYVFNDSQGLAGDKYQIQDVEFSGKKRWNGKITAVSPNRFLDAWLPPMTPKSDRPFNLLARLHKIFTGPASKRTPAENGGAYLFQVDTNGLQQLTQSQLAELNLEPRRTQLSINGRRIPVLTNKTGLLFYLAPEADRYADYDVIAASKTRRPPVGIRQHRLRSRCRTFTDVLPFTARFEENSLYYVATPTADPFFWQMVFNGLPGTFPFRLTGLEPGPAQIKVSLVGLAANASGDDHVASFFLNGHLLGEWRWNGPNEETAVFAVSDGMLLADNQLEVVLSPERPNDLLTVDRIAVTYPRQLQLEDGQLTFNAPSGSCVNVLVNSSNLTILDVSVPTEPTLLVGAAADGRSVQFKIPGSGTGQPQRAILVAQNDSAYSPIPHRYATSA